MQSRHYILICAVALLLSACATYPAGAPRTFAEHWKLIEVGMSYDEVYKLLGEPSFTFCSEDGETNLEYWIFRKDKSISIPSANSFAVYYNLKSKVVSVRQPTLK